MRVSIAALLLGVLLAAAADAQPKAPLTRDEALANIQTADVEARRSAAAWLGELGSMADAPALLAALRDADDGVRALAEHSLWQVWSRSGDAAVDSLFEIGVEQAQRGEGPAAIETFSQVIQRKPDFAEGWNKRATVYFLMGEYEKSLKDCDEVMKRNPFHFGALAGYGQIYLQLDEPERALEYFQRALMVNPNLTAVEAAVGQLKQILIERRRGTI
ncbi:MAG TPA: tetratricopeptide repeat protein [Methylomirabilota bacterium]|nr:tetratricopeptide repeat protein [Methylomirabilota bacterium]